MKKKLFLLTVLLSFIGYMYADSYSETVVIAYGTTASTEISFGGQTGASAHFQMIYPSSLFQSQINIGGNNYDAVFNEIKKITLHVDGTCTIPADFGFNFKVTLGTTSEANFTGKTNYISLDNSAVIYDNSASNVTGSLYRNESSKLIEITPGTTYSYNPTTDGNLVVDLEILSTGTTTAPLKFLGTTTHTNSAIKPVISSQGESTQSTVTPTPISFLAQLTFECGRIIGNTTSPVPSTDGKYILNSGTREAQLIEYVLPNNPGTVYDLACSSTIDGTHDRVLECGTNFISGTISIGTNNDVYSVTSLGSKTFSKTILAYNTTFYMPSSIKQIGNDNEPNMCFGFKYADKAKHTVIVFSGTDYPTIKGNINNTFAYRDYEADPTTGEPIYTKCVQIYFAPTYSSTIPSTSETGTAWDSVRTYLNNLGYCSYPYRIDFSQDPFLSDMSRSKNAAGNPFSQIVTVQPPFRDQHLTITLNENFADQNFDGTMHHYTTFKPMNQPNNVSEWSVEGNVISCHQDEICLITPSTNYYAELTCHENNSAALDAKEIPTNYTFLNGCSSLTFKVDPDTPKVAPEFKYTNAKETPVENPTEYLKTNTPIYVEKMINNKQYTYISLPFDCNVSDIKVKYHNKTSYTTSNSSDTLSLITTTYDKDTYESTYDKYMIFEYIGQDTTVEHKGSEAKHRQITKPDTILSANRGYLFATVESDDNYAHSATVNAIITFKYKEETSGEEKHIYIESYDDFKFVSTSTTDDDSNTFSVLLNYPTNEYSNAHKWNKGWSLVGSPFYHTVKASAFGKYATVIGRSSGQEGSVAYYNNVTHYSSIASNDKNVDIHPFEPFFVQADLDANGNASQISIDPTKKVYSAAPSVYAQLNRQEVVSVNLISPDGKEDYTSIIGDDSRDRNFRLGDDLAKMFNPWSQICSYFDSVPCAFKEIALRQDSTLAIPLAVYASQEGTHKFALDTSRNYFFGAVILHDKELNKYDNLTAEGIDVELTTGYYKNRFELVIVPSEIPSELEDVETSETLDAYVHDGHLFVENIEEGSTLSIYDISGKLVYSSSASGDFNYQFCAKGVYMIVLRGNTTGTIKVVY